MGTITCAVEASYSATTAGDDMAEPKLDGKSGIRLHEQNGHAFAGYSKGKKGRRLGGDIGMFLRRRTTVIGGGGGGMQVFVRTLAGKSLALEVSPHDTVDAVKARIQARERVAAGDQRLVFAGRDLDDGRLTLAEYGVTKEANLFLHLRLRGGADTGGSRWATAAGALTTVLAVGAALASFSAAAAVGTGGLTLAYLLLVWAFAMAGVNLITAGVYLTGRAETPCSNNELSAVISKVSAFVRPNLSILGIAAASSAMTAVIVGAADRVLICFVSFAVFLVAMSLVTFGVASCAR